MSVSHATDSQSTRPSNTLLYMSVLQLSLVPPPGGEWEGSRVATANTLLSYSFCEQGLAHESTVCHSIEVHVATYCVLLHIY